MGQSRAFVGGRILPMTARPSQPELVVVEDDRIVAVGERGLLDQFPGTVTEDLRGATLCPGFIDAHHHLSIAALHPQWADASRSTSPDDLAEVLLAQAAREPRTPWVRAAGWSDLGSGYVPHRRELDELEVGRPVLVAHYSLHQAVTDSRGLEQLGIGRASPDPPGGTIGRDTDGMPNGLLVERAWSDAHRRSLAPYDDPDRWVDYIEAEAQTLLTDGITAVHDTACAPQAEAAYRSLAVRGRLPVSVLVCPHPAALLGRPDGRRFDGAPTGEGNEVLRVGPVKLFADGGVLPAIDAHVRGRRINVGTLFGQLQEDVDTAVDRGFRVAVHAIGNAGLDAALDAFEGAARRRPGVDHRFRVEHACLATIDQLRRLAGLGGVAVVQPGFLHHMGGVVENATFDDATWLPFGDLERVDVPMAASSDAPCTFHEPVRTAAHGSTRVTSSGNVLDIRQAVPFEDWLWAYTAGAAYAGGQEHERGTLAPGMRADLVVLEGALDAERPPRVRQTWVGGHLAYEAPPLTSTR